MTVKQSRELQAQRGTPPYESLSEEQKRGVDELTTGISVTFIRQKSSETDSTPMKETKPEQKL